MRLADLKWGDDDVIYNVRCNDGGYLNIYNYKDGRYGVNRYGLYGVNRYGRGDEGEELYELDALDVQALLIKYTEGGEDEVR